MPSLGSFQPLASEDAPPRPVPELPPPPRSRQSARRRASRRPTSRSDGVGGEQILRTVKPSRHFTTNADIIQSFLPRVHSLGAGGPVLGVASDDRAVIGQAVTSRFGFDRTDDCSPSTATNNASRNGEPGSEFMRTRHQGDARARPHLSWNLVTYGDQRLRRVTAEGLHPAPRPESRRTDRRARRSTPSPTWTSFGNRNVGCDKSSHRTARPSSNTRT